MKRAALEKLRTRNVWLNHVRQHQREGAVLLCACEFEVGRFRKSQRIGGCSHSRCWLCHSEKLGDIPKVRQLRSTETYNEGLAEMRGL